MSNYCEACGLTACLSLAVVPCRIRAEYLKCLEADNKALLRQLSDAEAAERKTFPDSFENLVSELETHVSEWLPDHKQDRFYDLLHELDCRYELDKWVDEEDDE